MRGLLTERVSRVVAAMGSALVALTLALFAGQGVLTNVFDDHRDSTRSTYVIVAALTYTLAAVAVVVAVALVTRNSVRHTRMFVAILILSTLPYSEMFESDIGHVVNALVLAVGASLLYFLPRPR